MKMPDTIDFDVRVHGVPAGYKLVPIEAPEAVCGLMTGYGSDLSYMTERDRKVVIERGRDYWRDVLSAIPEPDLRVSMDVTHGVKACPGDGCNGCAGCWKVSETPPENAPGVTVDRHQTFSQDTPMAPGEPS